MKFYLESSTKQDHISVICKVALSSMSKRISFPLFFFFFLPEDDISVSNSNCTSPNIMVSKSCETSHVIFIMNSSLNL